MNCACGCEEDPVPDAPRPAQLFTLADYLWDELLARQWTIADAAGVIRIPRERLAQILTGARPNDRECDDIGGGLGTSGQVWINLRNAYEEWCHANVIVANSANGGKTR